jgi:hypothetical protein
MISNWKRKVFGYTAQGGSGGGSSGGQATQSNQYSNISPWAQPYVNSILGAAQQQVFNMTPGTTTPGTPAVPAQYDDQGNLIAGTGIAATPSSTSAPTINGINPYIAYGQNGAGMSASDQAAAQASVAGFTPLQQQSFNTAANMQVPGQYNQASNLAGTAGINALQSSGTAGQYGQMGAMSGMQNAGLSNMYGAAGAQTGQQAAGLSNMYGQGAIGQGQQGAAIGQSLGQQATNPGSLSAYMNPYIQNSLNPQLQLLNQQTGINSAAEQGAATSRGAFGGSREALANSLTQQTGNLAAQQAIAQGYNTAFTNAQQEMNAANQAALAGNAQAQTGYGQGLTAAQQAGQLGLAGTSQGLQGAQQAGQLGISGANAGLAGVQGQQAGYGLAGTQANNLANIGTQSLAAQQGIAGLQNTYGTQQQQNQQNVINQAMQNYQTAQQYPMQQLSQLNSLLAGKPITDVTTTQQAAAPTTFGQITGLGLTGLGAYGAANSGTTINTNVPASKKGGVIKKSKKYSMGGIVELSLYNAMKGQS